MLLDCLLCILASPGKALLTYSTCSQKVCWFTASTVLLKAYNYQAPKTSPAAKQACAGAFHLRLTSR